MTIPRNSRSVFARVLRFAAGYWRGYPLSIAAALAGVLVGTAIELALPLLAGRLIDTLIGDDSALPTAFRLLAFMAVLGLVHVTVRDRVFRVIVRVSSQIMTSVFQDSFRRVQRFSTDWHANSFAGATVRKITRGAWAIDTLDDVIVIGLLPATLVLVCATGLLAWHWPVLGLVSGIGSVLFIALAATLTLRYVAPAAQASNAMDSRLGGALADAIGCNATVKSFGAERREDALIEASAGRWRALTRRCWHRATTSGTLQQLTTVLLHASVLATALWLWAEGRATPGDVAYVIGTFALIQGYLREVGSHIRNVQRAINDMEELVDFMDEPLGVADRPGAGRAEIARGAIRFEDVTFRYGSQAEPIYDRFDLTIAAGERIGLVGTSGSGKSTFVKLVQRLYDLDGGRILIDGQDIADVTQESLRARIALVPQDPILFHRSLADNIAYGRPGAGTDEIEAAARRAHAHEFIARLPLGYDTLVGERGIKLSGGERQRVALARAILADAPILILDEATSSLDSVSEALIQDAVEDLMHGRTTIVVAHRLSTVQRMDRILVFERGRVVEQGRHEELVAREGGRYRQLFERQVMGMLGDQDAA